MDGSLVLGQLLVEDLPPGDLPLDVFAALLGRPHRLGRGGLQDLALSDRRDQARMSGAVGSGVWSRTMPSATASPSGW